MGKISKAFDKATQEEIVSDGSRQTASMAEEEGAPVSPPEPKKSKPVRQDTKGRMSTSWDERLTRATMLTGPAAESFRTLRSRILHPASGIIPKSLLITSAIPGEGKSFVCANLGVALAQGVDQHCLMVDCDLRKPALHKLFGLSPSVGLVNHLRDREDLSSLLLPTGVETLSLLPAGPPPVNPSELLGSGSMTRLIEEIENRYDDRIILLDSPPVQAASETAVLAHNVDGVVLVVRWGGSRREHLHKLVELIGPERIVGVVFNAFESNVLDSKVFGSYEYYAYEEET